MIIKVLVHDTLEKKEIVARLNVFSKEVIVKHYIFQSLYKENKFPTIRLSDDLLILKVTLYFSFKYGGMTIGKTNDNLNYHN